jgi:hypothetical protein
MRRVLRSLTLARLLVILTFVAVFVIALRAPLDTDTFWHLRAGEWQVQNRSLLRVDLFSHTRANESWVNHSWLSQLILYGAYATFGDAGLSFYTAILATAGMAFVYRQLVGDPLVRAFVIALAAAAAAVFWTARPQMMSFLLSTVILYLLWLYQKRNIDRLWFIPPIMVLWVNLHGGFAIAFILMVLAMAGEFARWAVDRRLATSDEPSPSLRPVLRIAVVGVVSAAAISLNPYGPAMLAYPFRTVGIGVLRDFIQEWASPNFHGRETWPFMWLLLGTMVAVGVSSRRLDWRDALLTSGTAYSALLAARNIPTFAIVAAPVLAEHGSVWLEERGYRMNWNRAGQGRGISLLNWLLLATILTGAVFKTVLALDPETIEESRRSSLPVEAIAYLRDRPSDGPMFNSYNWGGYLIWAARDYPVYIDGRTDLYDDQLLREYVATYFAQGEWEQNLYESGINLILVETSSPLSRLLALNSGWALLYQDDVAVIYSRRGP